MAFFRVTELGPWISWTSPREFWISLKGVSTGVRWWVKCCDVSLVSPWRMSVGLEHVPVPRAEEEKLRSHLGREGRMDHRCAGSCCCLSSFLLAPVPLATWGPCFLVSGSALLDQNLMIHINCLLHTYYEARIPVCCHSPGHDLEILTPAGACWCI